MPSSPRPGDAGGPGPPPEPPGPTRRIRSVHVLRTLLALGAVLPGLAAGLATLVWTRDRQRAIHRTIGLWGRHGTRAAGIRLQVEGAEHLERHRPCVFILNHPSGIDPIVVCALLKRDFVAVAKREIRRNPLLGPAFAFAGVVFVDRADTARAIEALAPAVEALRSGLSLAIAPEGTRSRGGARVGPFKKGAFRIALAARAPVVPIVLVNSDDVLPRGGWIMTPAAVRVVVLPPVDTAAWTLETLEAEIEAIRARYEAVLAGR